MKPTKQQQALIEAVAGGTIPIVAGIAGAGCGKTSTTRLVASALPANVPTVYTAFGRSVVEEAKRKLPETVQCRTMHSLAYRHSIGIAERKTAAGIVGGWRPSDLYQAAARLNLDNWGICTLRQHLGLLTKTVRRYCQSAQEHVEPFHVPVNDLGIYIFKAVKKDPTQPPITLEQAVDIARRDYARAVAYEAQDLFNMALSMTGPLPITQEISLKMFGLSGNGIPCDLLIFDEAQDVSQVMLQIVMDSIKAGSRLFAVGDPNQSIMGFTGAIDAIPKILALPGAKEFPLSISWRFGQHIADMANRLLAHLDGMELTGYGDPCRMLDMDKPCMMLSRSNAAMVSHAIAAERQGHICQLPSKVGDSMRKTLSACYELMIEGETKHPDLDCFISIEDALEASSLLSQDVVRALKLVAGWGYESPIYIDMIGAMSKRRKNADRFFSTAHSAKGLEWDQVMILDDFKLFGDMGEDGEKPLLDDELRLAYVAVTRARTALRVLSRDISEIVDRGAGIADVDEVESWEYEPDEYTFDPDQP